MDINEKKKHSHAGTYLIDRSRAVPISHSTDAVGC